ncbi:MAG: CHAT domain-containing tetratricopeptide repeat protein [Pseudomonadota bacterium]
MGHNLDNEASQVTRQLSPVAEVVRLAVAAPALHDQSVSIMGLPEGYLMARLARLLAGAVLTCGLVASRPAMPQEPDVVAKLRGLVEPSQNPARLAEVIPYVEQYVSLVRQQNGEEHKNYATAISLLGTLYSGIGRDTEAEPLCRRAMAIMAKTQGPNHIDVVPTINCLAGIYYGTGRYLEAEPHYTRALAITESALDPEHADVAAALNKLALLYDAQGRFAEAEPLSTRALAIQEKALGREHQSVGTSLTNLALHYRAMGRYAEAEALYKRALAIMEKSLGSGHFIVGALLNSVAELNTFQGRYAEAEPLFGRALSILETTLGPDHTNLASSLSSYAWVLSIQGRYAEAEPLYRRGLAIFEKTWGPEHRNVGTTLGNLALTYAAQGRYAEAEPMLRRALAISEKALGPNHPDVGSVLGNLAWLQFAQENWAAAEEYWWRASHVAIMRIKRGTRAANQTLTGKATIGADREGTYFTGLIKASHRLTTNQRDADSIFQIAQWAQSSEAAAALTQMAARSASGDPKRAEIVRIQQDLVAEWEKRDAARIAAVSKPPATRNREAEATNLARLAEIETRFAEIDGQLTKEFPDYADLASPKPLSLTDIRSQLGDAEALVMILGTPEMKPVPEETFIWVVTRSALRWVRSDVGTLALKREVAALRCGLDAAAWAGSSCFDLTGSTYTEADRNRGKPLPFDAGRAHKLYVSLFGEVAELIRGKHLLIVPSGSLAQLPFQVLVTKPPEGSDPRGVAWLARDHAITVLPAVSSLKALRRVGKPSAARKPILGFGNPLLDGPDNRYAELAENARANQQCSETAFQRLAALLGLRSPVAPVETRGGLAAVAHLKAQVPLPETADELCAVARDVGADPSEVRLGARASESEVKRLSAAGALADYKIIHFATHGALAGELDGTHEPGLLLTPPDRPSEEDDGYLSASEIAALKLDADWVILSACNTAAGGAEGAEALSGLARAFFYAQARALLVSHWAVNSEATVTLVTTAMRAMAKDPRVGRAEALRRAMLAMVDDGDPDEAHPSIWAPFVVVGEGASGR